MAKKKIIEVDAPGADAEIQTAPVVSLVATEQPAFIELIVYKAKDESLKVIKAKRAEYDEEDNAVASGNPVVDPNDGYVANEAQHEVTKVDFVTDVTLSFEDEMPYEDIELSPKYILRLFPDEYADEAVNGRTVGKEGKVQGLNFAILAKV